MKEVAGVEVIRLGKRNLKQDPIWSKIIRRFFPVDAYFQWAITAWSLIRTYPKGKWQFWIPTIFRKNSIRVSESCI
jgi:hypothetical protein